MVRQVAQKLNFSRLERRRFAGGAAAARNRSKTSRVACAAAGYGRLFFAGLFPRPVLAGQAEFFDWRNPDLRPALRRIDRDGLSTRDLAKCSPSVVVEPWSAADIFDRLIK